MDDNTVQQTLDLTDVELAILGAQVLDDKKADDVVILDVGEVLSVVGYFVVASAPNTRLVDALADEVRERVKEATGRSPLRSEGIDRLQWVLLDYGDVVFHVFLDEVRKVYDLERLWRDVPRVAWRAPE